MSDNHNQNVVPQCPYCGSTNVFKDALANWDIDRQEWVLASEYDSGHCESCETGLKRFNWVTTQPSTKD